MSELHDYRGTLAERARASPLVPPDWVFLTAWPLLKAAAVRADVGVARLPRDAPERRPLLRLRAADWVLFALFPAVAPRSGRLWVVVLLTGGQALATGEAMRRAPRRAVRASLAPQLGWLVYATAVPVILAASERRLRARPLSAAARSPRRSARRARGGRW